MVRKIQHPSFIALIRVRATRTYLYCFHGFVLLEVKGGRIKEPVAESGRQAVKTVENAQIVVIVTVRRVVKRRQRTVRR